MGAVTQVSGWLEWAVAVQPIDGGTACGDQHAVYPFPGGVLVAVVDGAGHGPAAQEAAVRAVQTLGADPGLPVEELIRRCHPQLRDTRGAVMSLASVRAGTLSWIGVGNVTGVVVRSGRESEVLLLRGGIVGQNLPPLVASTVLFGPGDFLVLATDGVRVRFDRDLVADPWRATSVAGWADAILSTHRLGTDDALVLVARIRNSTVKAPRCT